MQANGTSSLRLAIGEYVAASEAEWSERRLVGEETEPEHVQSGISRAQER